MRVSISEVRAGLGSPAVTVYSTHRRLSASRAEAVRAAIASRGGRHRAKPRGAIHVRRPS